MDVLIFDRSSDLLRKPGFTLQEGLPSESLSVRSSFLLSLCPSMSFSQPPTPLGPPNSSSLFPTCGCCPCTYRCLETYTYVWVTLTRRMCLRVRAQSMKQIRTSLREKRHFDGVCKDHLERNLRANCERTCPRAVQGSDRGDRTRLSAPAVKRCAANNGLRCAVHTKHTTHARSGSLYQWDVGLALRRL